MEPTLVEGDRLLCSRRGFRRVRDIVVRAVTGSDGATVHQVKRLVGLAGDSGGGGGVALSAGQCWIEGDNAAESGDSRSFGPVPISELVASAIALIRDRRLYEPGRPRPRRDRRPAQAIRDTWNDWRHGSTTRGIRSAESFGFSARMIRPSDPTPWDVIQRLLDELKVVPSDVLLDYGCGRGRVLVAARRYPFKRIIGIDVVPQLVDLTRANLVGDPRCSVHCNSAEDFEVPDDVSVVYFSNPFGRVTHEKVRERLADSLRRRPRRLRIATYLVGADSRAPTSELITPELVLYDVPAGGVLPTLTGER